MTDMGEPKTARLATRIDPAVKQAASAAAAGQDRSLSNYVELALKRALALDDAGRLDLSDSATANRS